MFHRQLRLSSALIISAVGMTAGSAWAGDVNPGMRVAMPLGISAPAPGGFLDFCRRTPTQCGSSSADIRDPAAVARMANQLFWQNAFARRAGSAPASTGDRPAPVRNTARLSRGGSQNAYAWNEVFSSQSRAAPLSSRAPVAAGLQRAQPYTGWPQTRLQASAAALSATDLTAPAIEPEADGFSYTATSASEIRHTSSGAPYLPATPRQPSWALTGNPAAAPALRGSWTASADEQFDGDANRAAARSPESDAIYLLTRENWSVLNRINRMVNRRIRQTSDESAFGQADYWQSPTRDGAAGDCEDYVLAKREALIEAGVPASALSIAIVETRWGESHAVLLVAGETGEVVLDSLSPWISRWDRVNYKWRERQAPGKVFQWVTIEA